MSARLASPVFTSLSRPVHPQVARCTWTMRGPPGSTSSLVRASSSPGRRHNYAQSAAARRHAIGTFSYDRSCRTSLG